MPVIIGRWIARVVDGAGQVAVDAINALLQLRESRRQLDRMWSGLDPALGESQ